MLKKTREAIVEEIWKKVDKYGISAEERFVEPLLVHIKELMPNSDQEVDIQIPMQEIANKLMIQVLNDYTQSIIEMVDDFEIVKTSQNEHMYRTEIDNYNQALNDIKEELNDTK